MAYPPLFHTKSNLGAVQVEGAPRVQFCLFFADGNDAHKTHIASIRVAGNFQSKLSESVDWDFDNGPSLTQSAAPNGGSFWTHLLDVDLPNGFYEYKYLVTFEGDTEPSRKVTDPCARYSGSEQRNSGFVIGGSTSTENVVTLLQDRKPLADLVMYEMHIGDFTDEFCGPRAPLNAVRDKLKHLQDLGINAILFMPWTAWPDKTYDWGYHPFQYFAVEYAYANDANSPEEKISWLKMLISECHNKGIHVIMDGVYNHCDQLFPYKEFYRDISKCPYTEDVFVGVFGGLQDLDFSHECTEAFIRDVCLYWISEFKIDGIRFDNTPNYYVENENDARGLRGLIASIQTYVEAEGIVNFSTTLEHLNQKAASVTTSVKATSYWDDGLWTECNNHLGSGNISPNYLGMLTNIKWLDKLNGGPTNRVPTIYLSNHDHSSVAWRAGLSSENGSVAWYRTQPHVIALLTSPGMPLIPNGQEFAEDYWIPENDEAEGRRVKARPLHWKQKEDKFGSVCFPLYQKLIKIRHQHAALRSRNIHPPKWPPDSGPADRTDADGFGVDVENKIVVYHRWSDVGDGFFYIALNFSDHDQFWTLHVRENGEWDDLLADRKMRAANFLLPLKLEGYWGHVLFKQSSSS